MLLLKLMKDPRVVLVEESAVLAADGMVRVLESSNFLSFFAALFAFLVSFFLLL